MKMTKRKFEDWLLDYFEEFTGEFAPLCLEIERAGADTYYIDRRSKERIAHWGRGIGTKYNFNKRGWVLPRLKINLKDSHFPLTEAGIWYSIERKAQRK